MSTDATVTMPEGFKYDAVNWSKRGNKITYGNVAELKAGVVNIRFREGHMVYGVQPKDTYDIPGMKQDIVELGTIIEPILVSVRANGDKITLRGNRRTFAGQGLEADPTTNAELLKNLRERTPMILLFGLTTRQEIELVNDQTQKKFLRSELVQHIFNLREQLWTYDAIAMAMWETIGDKFVGNATKLAEVRSINDPSTKKTKIKSWLQGELNRYLLTAYDLGDITRKAVMLTEMSLDGLLKESAEKPYFNTRKNKLPRFDALKKAKEADGTRFSGKILVDGTEFKKKMDEFHHEDYGNGKVDAKKKEPATIKIAEVKSLLDMFQSRAIKAALERVLGKEVPDVKERDEQAAIFEAKCQAVENKLPSLNPQVAAIVRICLIQPDLNDFLTFLEANCLEEMPITQPDPQENGEYSLNETVTEENVTA